MVLIFFFLGLVMVVNFREILEPNISSLIEQRKNEDREFADIYRNLNGKDVVDAIVAYLFTENQNSNLIGFKQIKTKQAPLYSLTELHFIPKINNEIYKLISPLLTVYSSNNINVNAINKHTL